MPKSYKTQLNEAINSQGSGFGPSLIRLLLYGPGNIPQMVSEENKFVLSEFEEAVDYNYGKLIYPKLNGVVKTFTGDGKNFPKNNKELFKSLKRINFEKLRDFVKSAYYSHSEKEKKSLKDKLCSRKARGTLEHMNSDRLMKENTYIDFWFDEENKSIVSTRLKQKPNSEQKYSAIWNCEISLSKKRLLPGLVTRVAKDPRFFWSVDFRKEILEKYGELERLFLGDYLGVRIWDLSILRAEQRLDFLKEKNAKLKVPGFSMVSDRFDDHTEDVKKMIPGGIHATLIDKGLSNYPLEVQYLDLESALWDMFGPNAYNLYKLRGKPDKRGKK